MHTSRSDKKILALGIIFFIALSFFGTYHQTKADCKEDNNSQYCLLEPLPVGNTTYDRYDPATTSTGDYINIIIKFTIGIIGVLGVVMIVLGGIQYMSTDAISKKEGGKEMITNSIFGIILAVFSWILLNTINPELLVIKIDPPKLQNIKAVDLADNPPSEVSTAKLGDPVCKQSPTINGKTITAGASWGSTGGIGVDTTERQALQTSSNGTVTVNAANCQLVTSSNGCTSLAGYSSTVLDDLVKLRNAVCSDSNFSNKNCTIKVTGGTECWLHSSHGPGLNVVDLEETPRINQYVTGKGNVINGNVNFPNDNSHTVITLSDGTKVDFLAEAPNATAKTTGSHWHVQF